MGAQLIADNGGNISGSNFYSTANGSLNLPYMASATATGGLVGRLGKHCHQSQSGALGLYRHRRSSI